MMVRRTRRGATILVTACTTAVMMPAQMLTAFAASAETAFSDPSATARSQVKVNMKISGSDSPANADITLFCDANVLEFVSGISAEGGAGAIRIHGDTGTSNTDTLVFTLQFSALAAGSSKISVTSQEIYDSSSQLVTVDYEGSSTVAVSALQTTSKDATLKNLKVSPGELSPAFSSGADIYVVTVGTDVGKLIISADITDDNTNKVISGNGGLQMGENRVTCKVTVQDGETAKEYVIVVTKAEGGASAVSADAGGQIKMEIPRRTITILPLDEPVRVLGGFKTSTINTDGHRVKGWVWGVDQELQYYVVYSMNEAGERNFYRYNMKDSERTIQRYFEDPVASSMVTSDQYNTLVAQYDKVREDFNLFRILPTVTVATAVVLLIILLVVMVNKKSKGGGRDGDTSEEPGGSRSRVAAEKRKQISSEGKDEYQEDGSRAYEDEDGYGDEYDEYDEYGGQESGDEDDEDESDEDGRVYDDRWKYEYQMRYKDEGEYEDRDEDVDERGEAIHGHSWIEHRPSGASQPLEPVQPMESMKPIDPVEPPKAVQPPKSAGPSRPSRPVQPGRSNRITGSAQPTRLVQPTRPVQTSKPEQPAGLVQDDMNDGFEIFDPQIHIDPYRVVECSVPQPGRYILLASVFLIIIVEHKKKQVEGRGIAVPIMEKLKLKETMTKTEEEIADFLLGRGSNIEKYSSRSLAEVTYVLPATIARMCKRMGFGGFGDFKIRYVREIRYLDQQPGEVDANFPFSEKDIVVKTANRTALLYEETAQDMVSPLRHDALQRVVKLPYYSQNVYVFSAGTVINQAERFREKVIKIGGRVTISSNFNCQLYEAGCLSIKDVTIIISYSGETGKTFHVVTECEKRSVSVIASTSFSENFLTKYATCKSTISTKESLFQNLGDSSTYLSVSLLLDTFYAAYSQQDYNGNYQRKLERTSLLERFRRSTSPIIMGREEKE